MTAEADNLKEFKPCEDSYFYMMMEDCVYSVNSGNFMRKAMKLLGPLNKNLGLVYYYCEGYFHLDIQEDYEISVNFGLIFLPREPVIVTFCLAQVSCSRAKCLRKFRPCSLNPYNSLSQANPRKSNGIYIQMTEIPKELKNWSRK